MTGVEATAFGFRFGPALVEALAAIERRPGEGRYVVVQLNTDVHRLEISVSPQGRSVRAFLDGRELK